MLIDNIVNLTMGFGLILSESPVFLSLVFPLIVYIFYQIAYIACKLGPGPALTLFFANALIFYLIKQFFVFIIFLIGLIQ